MPGSKSGRYAWPAALAAGYAFGLAPLVWSQAVITEVYGLQAFFVALILYLYTRPRPLFPFAEKQLDGWRGLALGLAVCNHLTTLLLVPAALALGSIHRQAPPDHATDSGGAPFRKLTLDRGALLRQLGMFAAGLSLYLILPLRALSNPPVNWGNPITLERFWWLVSGQLYRSYYLQFGPADLWERLQAWAALLLEQWSFIGLAAALLGLVYYFSSSRLLLFTLWQALIYSGFAMLYGSVDSYVYLLPVFISFSIWIGLGLTKIMDAELLRSRRLGLAVSLLFLFYLLGLAAFHWREVDASQDMRAEAFGREILESVPANAIVFAKGDEAVFSLWYFHFTLKTRPDLIVVAEDLLHFDWYQESLRATYPSLVVPGPFPWPTTLASSNPSHAICIVRYSTEPEVSCSPPAAPP